jgi:RND superfamily putative drug exporter
LTVANFLYRLGAASARRRWLVVGAWVAILVAVGVSAAAFSKPTTSAITIPGTESQRAIELLASKFPGTGGASARIVVAAPPGHTLTDLAYASLAAAALTALGNGPQVISVSGFSEATLSADKRIVFADVQYAVPVEDVTQQSKDALEKAAAPARADGLQVEFSGGVIATTEKQGNSELYGAVVAYLVLVLTLGGLMIAGMPLLNALIGIGIGTLGIQVISGFVTLSSTAPALATMLGLAVGIDYALFIVSRHRQQLRAGMAIDESIATATATAGSAVVFAGVTVVIALCGLSVAGIPFLAVMGLCAAGTVAVTVLLALTLVPALLGLAGGRIGKSRIGFLTRRAEPKAHPFGVRWGRIVTARPWLTIVACLLVVGTLALPVLHMRLGLPADNSKPASTTERRAYDLLTTGFGAGFNGPLTLVLSGPGRADMQSIGAEAVPLLRTDFDVAVASAPVTNKAGDVAILSVIPKSAPDSQQTKDLVNRIRAGAKQVLHESGVTAYVTGPTAFNIDVSDKLSGALAPFLVLIVVLALLLLLLVFRSILVPIKAVAGFLLSLGAALGAVTFVFQQGHFGALFNVESTGPVLSFLPILVIGILFGLAMDYEVFLVSRIREAYTQHDDAQRAIGDGMRASARVVTAAGLIMAAVFASFIFGGDIVIKSIGLALAVGVVVDAFIVRMTLVPAVLHLLGRGAWWLPGWLQRVLPDVDIEGARLASAPTDDEVDETVPEAALPHPVR